MTRPGTRLRSLAVRVCSQSTLERLIDPVIADMQREHAAAVRGGRTWRSTWTLAASYVAFWKVVAILAPRSTLRTARGWAARDDWAVGRTLGFAAIATMVVTALLIVPPLQSPHFRSVLTLWMLVLLMPQAIPLALPLGLLVGVLIGLRNRPTTNRVRRAIVILGFIGSLAMFGTVGWLVPEANQAYRVDIARRLAIAGRANSGGDISRGIAETPLPSLREQALDLKRKGHHGKAQELILGYHVRWSLSAAAFVFALFGFSLAALRLSRAGTIFAGTAPPLVYMTYVWELSAVDTAAFSERGAIALAWLPNVWLILASLALLSARRDSVDMDPTTLRA